MKRLTGLGVTIIVGLSLVLASCPGDSGEPGDNQGGNETLSEVFEDLDAEIITYRDVVLPPLPSLVTDSDNPALDDLKAAFQSVEDFVSTPAGDLQLGGSRGPIEAVFGERSSDPPSLLVSRAAPTPECFSAGPVTICTYQWSDDELVITLVDTRTTESYQTDWYFKGRGWNIDFPGDVSDPDDWGYLIQHHVYTTDCKSGLSQSMFVPDLCPDCEELPWAQNTFQVTGEMTIATPWSTDHVATYEYSNTVYSCEPFQQDPRDRYHLSLSTAVECHSNGDVSTDMQAYSYKHHAPFLEAHWFYDDSENSITWDFYDEDGKVTEHDTIP